MNQLGLLFFADNVSFSRDRDVRVLERYDDNRRDLGGEVAKQVAASVPGDSSTLE